MPTPHINANKGDIAKTVLMPGDPLRAKFIAETYLDHPVCYSEIRNMYGFTGTYQGKPVSIQGSGMGMPSMGIYSYELFSEFDVDNIIRIGSCGSFLPDLKLNEIVMGLSASTDSNYGTNYGLPGFYAPTADFSLLMKAAEAAKAKNIPLRAGNILSTDVFYWDDPDTWTYWAKMGVLAVEMEAAALYMNAARAGKKALCLLTVSDSFTANEKMDADSREKSFTQMMELALAIA